MVYDGKISTGRLGETAAAAFLRNNGYRIIARNFRRRLGEIDIIASDKDVICFIEVKTRRQDSFGAPEEAVSRQKQARISRAALLFLKQNNLLDKKARFDVVSIKYFDSHPEVRLIRSAFELDKKFCY